MQQDTPSGIRVAVVIGSVREGNYTSHAVRLVADEFARTFPEVTFDIIDPRKLRLSAPGSADEGDAQLVRDTLHRATAVVLATPEYHGSYSSVIKLVIENLGFPSGLAGKPVAMLGVAAGRIGAIKALEHLSSVVTHVGGHVLPGFVSVAGVQDLFDENGVCTDAGTEKRVRGLASNVMDYIHRFVCPRISMESVVRG
ncbi:MAG: NAD(P)H-dependent oxidoreductase [bacterium]|nr:NAD(P)H-dependent oxidoreductase [bacterium]